ncbi:hydrogenase maturation protease [Arthrobacter sp. NicSoilB8]|uniref:hydrogenase maturation protease n=1 Tax=Arthrobacter sp. NicSoilB8 TaxID=2830998 RepID=UPI001CC6E29E|nr:hydrogenase maturation protease [Arthrobacter sp. NicSoilB8]BCW69580.1 peptidase M52 [Arthrobacter sp. NicSoilB8]
MTLVIRPDPADGTAEHPCHILVAGVGNLFLRDDGFGPEVARRLAADAGRAVPGMLAVDYGIRGMHLAYDLLAGVDILVLVDTVPPDALEANSPGCIRVLRVGREDLDGAAALDPHGMDPVAVLGRLRSLGGELPLTFVVGCVPADLSEGIGLTGAVAAAVPRAMVAVVDLVTNPNREGAPCA